MAATLLKHTGSELCCSLLQAILKPYDFRSIHRNIHSLDVMWTVIRHGDQGRSSFLGTKFNASVMQLMCSATRHFQRSVRPKGGLGPTDQI